MFAKKDFAKALDQIPGKLSYKCLKFEITTPNLMNNLLLFRILPALRRMFRRSIRITVYLKSIGLPQFRLAQMLILSNLKSEMGIVQEAKLC